MTNAVSLAMAPVNAAVGAASARVSDRLMVCAAVVLCTLCLAALAWAATLPVVFFTAGVLLFVGTGGWQPGGFRQARSPV